MPWYGFSPGGCRSAGIVSKHGDEAEAYHHDFVPTMSRALHFCSARHVPEAAYRQFPGLVDVRPYRGALGDLALVIVHKPSTA